MDEDKRNQLVKQAFHIVLDDYGYIHSTSSHWLGCIKSSN